MPNQPKITCKDYYDYYPSGLHATGDIWRNLPAFGLLDLQSVTGIVITPACDLAQRKCETVTYLPIVSIEDYVSMPAFYMETWKAAAELLERLQIKDVVTPPARYELPDIDELDVAIAEAKTKVANAASRVERLEEYALYVKNARSKERATLAQIEKILSKDKLQKLLEGAVKNSMRVDAHFLPADGQSADSSAVPRNSLALFRYPISIPIEALDAAQGCDEAGWLHARKQGICSKVAEHFVDWPVKLGRLKDDFLSDLLSRYVTMYIRLGSRDFSEESIDQFVAQIRGSE